MYTDNWISARFCAQFSDQLIIKDKDEIFGESDSEGITSVVYKDSITREGIMVDCGASPAMKKDPTPIIAGLFERHNVKNVCLSHAHFDHMNGLCNLGYNKIVHMTQLAARYVRRELGRHRKRRKFKQSIFTPRNLSFTIKDSVSVGPFQVVPILVPHSIAESCMLLIINSKGRAALDCGDMKIRGVDWHEEILVRYRLAQIGQLGIVDAMRVDNLNCHRPGFTFQESGVCESLGQIIKTTKDRVVIGVFATNLRRIKAIANMALKSDRDVEFVGSSMRFAEQLLKEEGWDFPCRGNSNPVVFTSGCQGETDSTLWREAEGTGGPLGLGKGDTVIFSSHKIPGNEKSIASVAQKLVAKGCRVIVNNGEVKGLHLDPKKVEEAFTHVSGHGQRADVEMAVDLVKPKVVIPSIRRGPQFQALQEICAARGIKIKTLVDNCFVF